jgi:uncharacterized protein (UPF0261 family)
VEDNRNAARFIAQKVNRSTAPIIILLPEKGVSMIDAPGQPFYDPAADAALFEELEKTIKQTPSRQIRRVKCHINDPEFAKAIIAAFKEVTAKK